MGMLEGKTALVTGAGRGIGRAIAVRLAADGALVGVHYGSSRAGAEQTVAQIRAAGGAAFPVAARLGEPGDAERLWAGFDRGLAELGAVPGLDILVNNAGIPHSPGLAEITPEQFDEIFAVNVKAPFFLVRAGLDRMRDHGRIVNISSGVTRVASPGILAYSMTKGALDTFSFTLAQAVGGRGITVNSVSPGVIDTDANAGWLRDDPQAQQRAAAYSPMNRIGQPADVADLVAMVVSPDARWLTGQDIDATGGAVLTG
ncbi:SDR family oxidoreductase [Winogradskya humida]|uniref:Short-chain dehydrogenase n=1 Tax=Winogradskya humida TaxID=113566 RepID=A0ABQ3ZYV9_9ACTN|nr:SDR family oxidoreductase [Actinoplanes humidus]GIE23332.1 short-chain dehydrogenase [Actinoplanes humidus]